MQWCNRVDADHKQRGVRQQSLLDKADCTTAWRNRCNCRYADGLIRISVGDDGSNISPAHRNPVSVAVAVAGVLQSLSNFKFATVNTFVYKLFKFEPYSAEYW